MPAAVPEDRSHDPAETGLLIFRASRLEALLGPLQKLMRAAPPPHPLAPHEIIVAHPGMLKWLSRALARAEGVRGISANLRIELPSEWLDRLAVQVLGAEAVALRPYRREVLRWLVHDALGDTDDPRLSAFLAGGDGDGALRRFQLADRIARTYSRYLVYRPDWLRGWAEGHGRAPAHFLGPLWRRLRTRIGRPHRGELLERLVSALAAAAPQGLPEEPLHVFGIAHLAPSELDVLRSVAQRRLVALYVPDPCREYWGGLRDGHARLLELARSDPDAEATQSAFLSQDHPLLASWGRLGQQFLLALEDAGARSDTRHHADQSDTAPVATRLQRLQESMRALRPELLRATTTFAAARADDSLRVHACHTRLRELEVLRDALLALRARDPTIRPADIVVMMPDVHAYLPLLPAVFGEAGRHEGPLPYHCFDVAASRSHSLFAALRQLLDLPQSRIAAPQVVDLLGVPEIARRLGLDGDGVEALVGWLSNSRVAWALDERYRERFDVPAIAEQTFAWAMDRLLTGYVVGDAATVVLPDGSRIAPVDGVRGPQAALVGALDALLVELQAWCDLAATPRRASEWSTALEARFEALFRIDPTDARAREARALVLRFLRAIAAEPGDSGTDPTLEFAVVRELLLQRLDAVPERQRFLLGGVTFCGMVPQRAIPFRVVAALGLDDGAFPRRGGSSELDLMATQRRLGDRDTRSDDRYLFLETVMSARDALHLSYIGEGVRDGEPRNPAAPLAELMAALEAEVVTGADAIDDGAERERQRRPWLVRHPLQPFDARYFDAQDAALFSFDERFARMRIDARSDAPAVEFLPGTAPDATTLPPPAAAIELRDLLAYYKDPSKQLLAGALNLRLDAVDDDRLRDSETLEPRLDAIDRVARRLFLDAVARPDLALPETAPDWLRLTGMLPPGRVGDDAFAMEREVAAGLVEAARRHALFRDGLPPAQTLQVERTLPLRDGRTTLRGELRRVFARDDALWLMECYVPSATRKNLDFKQRIPFFIEWALLRLAVDSACPVHACPIVPAYAEDGWSRRFADWQGQFARAADAAAMLDDLARRLAGLVDFWRARQSDPRWYFPGTSWALAPGGPEKARARWLGKFGRRGERDYAPGYARLLAGDRDLATGDDLGLLLAAANRLRSLIDVSRPLAEAT